MEIGTMELVDILNTVVMLSGFMGIVFLLKRILTLYQLRISRKADLMVRKTCLLLKFMEFFRLFIQHRDPCFTTIRRHLVNYSSCHKFDSEECSTASIDLKCGLVVILKINFHSKLLCTTTELEHLT